MLCLKIKTGMYRFQKEGGFFLAQKIKQVGDLSIGGNLQQLRKNAGLSQEAVAARLQLAGLDVSRETLSQIERGCYNVRVSVLRALKDMYAVESYDDFFSDI